MSEVTSEDDGEYFDVSLVESASVTAGYLPGPDDDGTAGVREPLTPQDAPPSLAAEVQPDHG